MMNKYKHTPDTLKKAKYYLGYDLIVIIFTALFAFVAVCAIIVGITDFAKTNNIFTMLGGIIIAAAAIVFLFIFANKIKKRYELRKELKKAREEESEFFKINCKALSYMRVYVHRYSPNNGKVQGFYLLAEGGEEYVYLLEDLMVVPLSEEIAFENKELTGELYVRKYKGTNLLCEIRKEI
ncbi:MAG: hypothetical protein IJW21_07540 [Clostridia bacterium]|nr:hypothetical protein [Clostridia bacterium]